MKLGLAALLIVAQASGQRADSVRPQPLDPLVVTVERTPTTLMRSVGAVSVISQRELARLPVRTLAEALQQTPGFALVDFDGLGVDPQPMVRGYYGGGEAEYVVLLLDGRPLNAVENGRINWELIPLSAVQSIEVGRGGSSPAWGDAALGGVINVITRPLGESALHGSLSGGGYGVLRGSLNAATMVAGRPVSLNGHGSALDGFRAHAERSSGGLNASIGLSDQSGPQWSLNTQHDWRSYDEPGPLADTELAGSRSQSSPFYRFDHATERFHRLGVDVSTALSSGSRFSGYLTGEYRHSDRVRTLALAPTFADTKNRVLTGQRVLGSVHLYVPDAPLLARDELVLGVDASVGRIKSSYYNFGQGTPDMYSGAAFTRGELDAKGSATRSAAAGFLRYNVDVAESLRLSAGARLDWLHDRFDPSDSTATTASHLVLSPGVGVNLRLSSAPAHEAHLFANVTRSFKAPTPDQLFDQRGIPVPFPPFRIAFANRDLRPQHGVSFEAGFYQRAQLAGALTANLSLAAYQTDLRDELDFDVSTFRYENIGRSRHRGIEAGVALHGPGLLSGFTNYTWQAATARAGDHDGKYLKALPRHFIVAGVSAGRSTGFLASISATTARTMYVDDANTQRLPDWTRWDARLSYGLRAWQLYLDVFNLADAEYSTTGFPDPAGSDVVYYYPAAGRTLELGVRWR